MYGLQGCIIFKINFFMKKLRKKLYVLKVAF